MATIYTCDDECSAPTTSYEALVGLSEKDKLLKIREGYVEAAKCYEKRLSAACSSHLSDENRLIMLDGSAGIHQALETLNNTLIDMDSGIPTNATELMTTFLGTSRDEESLTTRRTKPLGTVITEIDGYADNIPIATTKDVSNFEKVTVDDVGDPDFVGIDYVPSTDTTTTDTDGIVRPFIDFTDENNKDKYSEVHASCLDSLPCTYDEPKIVVPEKPLAGESEAIVVKDLSVGDVKKLALDVDVAIADEDITSGCANGTGLFDKLMTSIDSSISLQFKNSRLDNKTFGQFYASAISAAMQQTTQFLVQEKQLLLDKAKLDLSVAEYNTRLSDIALTAELKKEESKYNIALIKEKVLLTKSQVNESKFKAKALQTEVVAADTRVKQLLIAVEEKKKRLPLELSLLTQEVKGSEKKVELSSRQIEEAKASVVGIYNNIGETNATNKYQRAKMKVDTDRASKDIAEIAANGILDRNLTVAKTESTRVQTRVAKFDAILKKYQAYATKVSTTEAKASGASSRRLTNADIQSKNKQASLYDQQRKMYIHGQRVDVLKIMKDMWNVQIDTLGAEGMAVEAIKGPEFSAKLERAGLDVGI